MSNLTEVILLKTKLDNDYLHTLYFVSDVAQYNYFTSLPKIEFDNFSYQRKDSLIRIPAVYDDVVGYNYVMYRNKNYSNKWYYAFITDIKFFSEGKTDVYIETDVMQTYMFNYTIGRSFVEREHVNDDTIGLHTMPEQVQLGDFVINEMIQDENLELDTDYVIYGSTLSPGELANVGGGQYGGVYSGVRYYLGPTNAKNEDGSDNVNYIAKILQMYADNGKIDAVSSLFTIPKFIRKNAYEGSYYINDNATPYNYNFNITKNYGFEGYQPKNNKLKTSPYTYLLVSNGNGSVAEYQYEHFGVNPNETDINFMVFGIITPGCSIRMIPAIYKGVQLPESEGLNAGKYPTCNWATDQFTNWLTQNGVNVVTSIIDTGVNMGVGAIVGGPAGAITGTVSGVSGILSTINEVSKAQRIPPQLRGNVNNGDVVASRGDTTFTYYAMSIKKEYAEMIDNYFSMYGYKVNALKVPNKNHRKNYWYTKTIDVVINSSTIPQTDLQKIKDCYNKGITFWRSENFKNYDVDNEII